MGHAARTVEIRLVEANGHCSAGHNVGDTFLIPGGTDRFTCDGLCIHALYSLFPKLIALRYGAAFPWVEAGDEIRHACPDAASPHTFTLRVLP